MWKTQTSFFHKDKLQLKKQQHHCLLGGFNKPDQSSPLQGEVFILAYIIPLFLQTRILSKILFFDFCYLGMSIHGESSSKHQMQGVKAWAQRRAVLMNSDSSASVHGAVREMPG